MGSASKASSDLWFCDRSGSWRQT